LGADDVLVLPEGFGPGLAGIAPGIRKAIFNQNAYRTFHGYPANLEPEQTPYLHPDVLAVITISEDNRRYVGLAFPTVNVVRLHYSYDPVAFPFRAKKARRLAYMPRKNSFDAHQVLSILRLRGVLKGWEVTVIDGMSEAQTSAVLQEASIFLSFGHPEGCPLPPAEAMLAGAIVIGYHGMGGREYFKTEHAFPIDVGDISAFAETAESVLAEFDVDDSRLRALAERAAAYIRATYPPEQEEREVVALWRSLTA
jgi:hypothetical protein